MTSYTNQVRFLHPEPINVVAANAMKSIEEGVDGTEMVFRTRFDKFNYAMSGGLRMGTYMVIAGASGHGKSYFLHHILEDIVNPALNPYTNVKILHFSFDMPAEQELLRAVAGEMNMSYADIKSSHTKLAPEQVEQARLILQQMGSRDNFFYVSIPGTKEEIQNTVYKFHAKFPDDKLVVSVDHSLLTKYSGGESGEIELVSKISKTLKTLRQELGIMAILLGQLNDKIEDPRRKTDPNLMYPTKTDLHGSKAVFHDADAVMILHRPSEIGIRFYGPARWDSHHLAALHIIKNRSSHSGIVLLKEDLAHSKFLPHEGFGEE